MTEYWVSKKQYWCKYCSLFIRDDAPSRRQHETGLKHLGQKERYIRDLYKTGDMAKREKAAEAAEMARIEAAAAAAHAHDTLSGASTSRPSVLQSLASASSSAASSSRIRETKPTDKWANYSTAEQLGFDDEDTKKGNYEIEQELKGRAGEVGRWEEVAAEPSGLYTPDEESAPGLGGKRKRIGGAGEDDEGENFKFAHDNRTVDPYDDDWDPKALKLKVRVKEEKKFGNSLAAGNATGAGAGAAEKEEGALKREGWSGKLELKPAGLKDGRDGTEGKEGMRFDKQVGGWVKSDLPPEVEMDRKPGTGTGTEEEQEVERKPTVLPVPGGNAVLQPVDSGKIGGIERPTGEESKSPVKEEAVPAGGSMFKKRRPPPSSRKK